MLAKYSEGAKVKIKARYFIRQVWFTDLIKYENMTGTVLGSKDVVAYMLQQISASGGNIATTIPMYSIEMEDGTMLYDVADYYLEEP